jgi:hypothetical protein
VNAQGIFAKGKWAGERGVFGKETWKGGLLKGDTWKSLGGALKQVDIETPTFFLFGACGACVQGIAGGACVQGIAPVPLRSPRDLRSVRGGWWCCCWWWVYCRPTSPPTNNLRAAFCQVGTSFKPPDSPRADGQPAGNGEVRHGHSRLAVTVQCCRLTKPNRFNCRCLQLGHLFSASWNLSHAAV